MRGQDGWNQIINTSMENAAYLYEKLCSDNSFAVVCKPEISSVVFRYSNATKGSPEELDELNKKIRRQLIHEHGIVIGQTVSDQRVCLKFTLLNPLITHEKLDELLVLIKNLAEQ